MRPQIVKNIKILAPIALCFLISTIMLGQADARSSGPPAPNMERTPPDLSLPIDSGLLFLLIAGLGYGLYITTKRMKAKNISR
ncbi:MAG: hypothetical protein ACI9M9_002140 [Flavobacteriaceae bacterium]|jgi:hypothetical protein